MKIGTQESQALKVLASGYSECEPLYFYFKSVAKKSGLSESQARRAVRSLARKGLAEYSILWDDDGHVMGSGYCCSRLGAATCAPAQAAA